MTAATILASLLFSLTLVFWVRSYFVSEEISFAGNTYTSIREYQQFSLGTGPVLHWWVYNAAGKRSSDTLQWHAERNTHGFHYAKYRWRHEVSHCLWLPHWFTAVVFAILPTTRLISYIRRRRRVRAGHCATCGYDLRATPERCPECGAINSEARNQKPESMPNPE
jgi:hypothetical protein